MIKVIFCDLDGNRCSCKDEWDYSGYQATCANQKGCTDCDGSGYTWCFPTNNECDTVERNGYGDSQGWFRCEGKTINHLAQTAFESISLVSLYFCIRDTCDINYNFFSAAATCQDGIMNQDETGIDCGGATCNACRKCPLQ